jgi:hypothetical protein
MLPVEASRRLVLSENTLGSYEASRGVGTPSPKMIRDEVETLRGIATLFPNVAELVDHLAERWIAYATANGLTLN